jgi:hypothetical protein
LTADQKSSNGATTGSNRTPLLIENGVIQMSYPYFGMSRGKASIPESISLDTVLGAKRHSVCHGARREQIRGHTKTNETGSLWALFHVMGRGIEESSVLRSHWDREDFLTRLGVLCEGELLSVRA